MEILTATSTQVLYFETNFNNKLACNNFLHITLAPGRPLGETALNLKRYEIRTTDNSHPPIGEFRLTSFLRMPLIALNDLITWQSHAMDAFTFKCWFMDQNNRVSANVEMGVYFYEKVMNINTFKPQL